MSDLTPERCAAFRGIHIHIPKTGGTTLAQVWPRDDVYATGHTPWKTTVERLSEVDPTRWDRLFKFSFIRNPYDRNLSWFFSTAAKGVFRTVMRGPKKRDWEYQRELFHSWMDPDCKEKHGGEGYRMVTRPHYTVSELITDDGVVVVGYLARYERYAKEVEYIFERLGIEPLKDVRTYGINRSPARPSTGHYSWWYGGARGELIKGIVTGIGHWELNNLYYTFEEHGDAGRP
jgi:hypothetical protein